MTNQPTMVQPWVRDLVEGVIGPAPVEVGKRYRHPEHGVVRIESGQYWGLHGISNFWRWTDAQDNHYSGYAGDWPAVEDAQ